MIEKTDMQFHLRKRRLVQAVALWPWLAGCTGQAGATQAPQQRFKGIGLVLVADAVPGVELRSVKFTDDRGSEFFSASLVAKRTRKTLEMGSGRVPLTVRVIWREGAGWDAIMKIWNNGAITGDYKVSVAERILQAALDSIRREGGGLRLKYRLKANGVLFGWDIERVRGGATIYSVMPGGDFLDMDY